MSGKNSQAGDNFLSDVFKQADPTPLADMLARHDAALQRIARLERACEKAVLKLEEEDALGMFKDVRKVLQKVLDG